MYRLMVEIAVSETGTLTEISFGAISPSIGKIIQKSFGFTWFRGIALLYEKRLIGTIILIGKTNIRTPEKEELTVFAGITTNILVQHQVEQALRESQEKFKTLADSSPSVILVYQGERLIYAKQTGAKWKMPGS